MPLPSLHCWRNWIPRLPRPDRGLGEITSAASITSSAGAGSPLMRVFGQWALVYMVAGKGFYRDDRGIEKTVLPGSWILVFPEIAHAYGPLPGEEWHEVYVTFCGPVFEAWRASGYFTPAHPVGDWLEPAEGVLRFRRFFNQIEKNDCTGLKAVCLFQNLLGDIFGRHEDPALGYPDWLTHAFVLLEKARPDQSLAQIATACGLGYESFRKKFEAYVGTPPGHYALSRRVEQARRLMAMRQLTNKEIAELLGFYDEFHFSKVFSRLTGKTPRQFRSEHSSSKDRHGE